MRWMSLSGHPESEQLACLLPCRFGLTYLLILLMVTLERYNKWHYLKHHNRDHYQHPEQQRQPQPLGPGSASLNAQTPEADGSNPTYAHNLDAGIRPTNHYSHSQGGLFMDPYRAPTAWVLLRLELLKLVVLADIPVLMLWWVLSNFLRPALPAMVQQA
jgi:hypothetical protein